MNNERSTEWLAKDQVSEQRTINGVNNDGDRLMYHDLLDCDRICTTIDSSIMLSVAVKRPNLLVGVISEPRPAAG